MRLSSSRFSQVVQEACNAAGEKKCLNSELWHACAGPLVFLPLVGSRVVYFLHGPNEQVAASTNKEVDAHIPNYPNLPPRLICELHNMTMHPDAETDGVYAQMTLQPLSPQEQKDIYLLPTDLGTTSKQPTNYCKTLTASDTSTHGGFSVPQRAAEKVFPPLIGLLAAASCTRTRSIFVKMNGNSDIYLEVSPKGILRLGGVSLLVLRSLSLVIQSFSSGMKKINYCWVFGEQIIPRLSCHHQFCQVIACTLVFLLLLLM